LLIPALALLASLSGCIIVDGEDSTLTIQNDSSYTLLEIRVAEEFDAFWSNDLTGSDVLFPGEAITVALDCGVYDVQVIDDEFFACELRRLDLCFDDAIWFIDDFELVTCSFAPLALASDNDNVTKQSNLESAAAAE
ncbi:MAG: hypothetical protein AAGC55_30005, partial [Myxococcota bacterium]